MTQLTLNVNLRDDATFANFIVGANQTLFDCLQTFVDAKSEHFIYLWGDSGAGCSHLLQACCHAVQAHEQASLYLDLSKHAELSPSVLGGMEHMALVAFDHIDAVVGMKDWEEALFHFYNRARDCGLRLIVAATVPPKQLPCVLADLQSRLSWGLTFKCVGLSDEEKLMALVHRAKRRGMHLSTEVGNYLLHHYSRDMESLIAVLDQLDNASLKAQRRLTIPFVKLVLQTGYIDR